MEVNAGQVLEILNKRAQTEPLIQEILRSAMFEAALMARDTTPIQPVGDLPDKPVDMEIEM